MTVTTDRAAARQRARVAWADLRDRLATVTPAAAGRAALGVVVLATMAGLAVGTWPALLPFGIGALLAYAVLPVVDALDHILPRSLAAVLSMLGVVAILIAVVVIVLPPLATGLIALAGAIPASTEIQTRIDDLLAGLPESTRSVAGPILIEVARVASQTMSGASGQLDRIVPLVFQAALGVAGAILGLIVLPAWMLTLMTGKQRGRRELDSRLAGWLRPDFWAIVRMADLALGTYLRGFVVAAFLIGLVAYLGFELSPRLGGPEYPGALALATFAGAVQVIPELGPIIGFFPALLLLAASPEKAAVYLVVYVVARFLGGSLVGGRLMEERLRVHPAVLIPGVVVLSQVGPLWLLLSAPILAFASDLVRYAHGRLSEPPRPAGLLPGEPLPAPVTAGQATARVPAVYRGRATASTPARAVGTAATAAATAGAAAATPTAPTVAAAPVSPTAAPTAAPSR